MNKRIDTMEYLFILYLVVEFVISNAFNINETHLFMLFHVYVELLFHRKHCN